MSILDNFRTTPRDKTQEILADGELDTLIDLMADVLDNIVPAIRPRNSRNKPGAIFQLNPIIEKVLYFGDLHPARKNIDNFLKAMAPHFRLLQEGRLAIVVAGDFTHPATDDLTDMEPSVMFLQQVLIPLKILFNQNVVLLRGDHETVGNPYGEDFGKGTDFVPPWTLEKGLEAFIESGLVWAMGPNKPEFSGAGRFTGIYNNSPQSERYSIGGKEFGRETFKGSWYTFKKVEVKDSKEYFVFEGVEKNPPQRWVRIERGDDRIQFFLEEENSDILCSLALNQSRAYGLYVERIGGQKTLEKLQYRVYDRLPLVVRGNSFAGVHGSPIEKLSPSDDKVQIEPLTRQEIIELSNPKFRHDNNKAYRRLIFGRPIEGKSFSFTPQIVEDFLIQIGNDPKDLFLMAHTRPDHFLEGYKRIFPKRGTELLLNQDIYTPFGPGWQHLVIDSQSMRCSHLLIENRRPNYEKNESIKELFTLKTIEEMN
ncbi:metallophosphoesterase [candidate division CSSED10-310 bacterium]|uniref:Metallophosphoesterase n=1 Tax=candidate division CSSED10-310 bacterium TaxID=2855610 RepID=A0ABV6Z0A2_UNCC1